MQFVMSDSKRMEDLDDVTFTRVLAKEISRYIPEVGTDAVKFYVPHRNTEAPLFINEVGTWKYRPTSRSKLPGLYFAGDYVQNETDVASMEGAVRTGFMAAEAVRFDHVQRHPPIAKVPPVTLSDAGMALAQLYLEDPVLSRLNMFAGLAARFAEDARLALCYVRHSHLTLAMNELCPLLPARIRHALSKTQSPPTANRTPWPPHGPGRSSQERGTCRCNSHGRRTPAR